MAREDGGGDGVETSTQNTQYDEIGTNYMAIKEMGAVEAELPSVVAALGRIDGKRCLGMLSFLLLSLGGPDCFVNSGDDFGKREERSDCLVVSLISLGW
jgi:hypothetical protein